MSMQAASAGLEATGSNRPSMTSLSLVYWLLLPAGVLILFVNLYPLVSGFLYSLQDGTMLRSGTFVGLSNYVSLFTRPDFLNSLWFSALFAFFSVSGSYAVGLALALLLNQEFPARGFFRVALLVPWIIPPVVSMVSWRWMIGDSTGLVNVFLGLFGIEPIYFLSDRHLAIVSVIVVKVWLSFPFMMVSCLAALQTINRDLYEAAEVDGANPWQTLRFITLPLLRNISVVLWILMTIWTVNDFDTPFLLTGGGPSRATENLIVLAYRYTFQRNDVGAGTAVAFVTMVVLMSLTFVLLRRQATRT